MPWKTLVIDMMGKTPLLTHNSQLSDPLNPWSKKLKSITSKKKKTDADHEEAARIEWKGGLYLDAGPKGPVGNI